jgi:hypothetical protein
MTTSLAQLNQLCRDLIGDPVTGSEFFSNTIIEAWINAALRDLSLHFPLRATYTISTTAGTHKYDLETNHLAVLSVEYPTGEEPPAYLTRRGYTEAGFWSSDSFYDVIVRASGDDTSPPELWISANPPAGETITLELTQEHTPLSSSTDETTLPDRLVHLVPLFVRWQAWLQISTREGMDPDPAKLLAATHEVNAGRAERAYRAALREAKSSLGESTTLNWRMDHKDRVY